MRRLDEILVPTRLRRPKRAGVSGFNAAKDALILRVSNGLMADAEFIRDGLWRWQGSYFDNNGQAIAEPGEITCWDCLDLGVRRVPPLERPSRGPWDHQLVGCGCRPICFPTSSVIGRNFVGFKEKVRERRKEEAAWWSE